jgi:hypothetical protein
MRRFSQPLTAFSEGQRAQYSTPVACQSVCEAQVVEPIEVIVERLIDPRWILPIVTCHNRAANQHQSTCGTKC